MAIKDVRLSEDEYAFSSIAQWAEQLEIPAAYLLHHASTGALSTFFIPSPNLVALRYVDTSQLDLASFESDTPPVLASEALQRPLYTELALFGIQLEPAQCAALASGKEIRAAFFDHVMMRGLPHMAFFSSRIDAWNREMPPGTRIASFSTVYPGFLDPDQSSRSVSASLMSSHWNRTPEEYARTPVAHLVKPSDVLVRDVDIRRFIHSLTSYAFISDCYHEKRLADDMPSYVSEKLEEIVLVNRVFWKEKKKETETETEEKKEEKKKKEKSSSGLTPMEVHERNARAVAHLNGDFREMCPRTSSPDGLIAFASQVSNPTIRPNDDHPSVTPSLLSLLTASKVYWSPKPIDLHRHETLPEPASVTRFLRFMGLTDDNDAASGAVIIRPNNAINHKPRHQKVPPVEPLIAEIESRRRRPIEAIQKWQATPYNDDSPGTDGSPAT